MTQIITDEFSSKYLSVGVTPESRVKICFGTYSLEMHLVTARWMATELKSVVDRIEQLAKETSETPGPDSSEAGPVAPKAP